MTSVYEFAGATTLDTHQGAPVPAEPPVLSELRMAYRAPDVEAPLGVAILLADRTRASILALLADGPVCVCEMAAALDARENNVSNHLARLRDAGRVRTSRHGADSRRVYYERDEAACAAAALALEGLLR
jgi:DNA-binding transcriptional ArsR family regulator